jgi:hypothetical protein
MLFVPSKNGITHAKEEDTDVEQVAIGVECLVLAATRALAL